VSPGDASHILKSDNVLWLGDVSTGEKYTMDDRSNIQLPCIELSDDELEAVSGCEIDIATFFQCLSSTLRAISDTNKAMIANIR
jgi:hypothetical protein